MKKWLATTLLLLISSSVWAITVIPIPADQAFKFSATLKTPNTIVAQWKIAPGYYLYKDRISFKVISPNGVSLGEVTKPQGIDKEDNILGKYQVYADTIKINLPLNNVDVNQVKLLACFQGCSYSNFCYPPITKEVTINLTQDMGKTLKGTDAVIPSTPPTPEVSEQDKITQILAQHNWWLIGISFFTFGLLLSLTPCVLPMIPILSGIIIGHGKSITSLKAFWLSFTYVMGMAITYAIVGIIAGLAGSSIQAAMQSPWIISLFSFVFVLLALSLFGLFEIRLPEKFSHRIANLSNHQKSGSYIGAAIMGVLSTLIVSPCVTAPLIGALAYIGNTGDATLGGIALFIMALGMGIPLLVIGTFGGKLLPKAGNWMNVVKACFGVLMLVVAIWMLSRIIPAPVTMFLWAGLLLVCAVFMGLFNGKRDIRLAKLWRGISLVFAVYGIILMIGAAMGNTNPLKPLANLAQTQSPGVISPHQLFTRVKTPADLNHELNSAKHQQKITMLDFYADWCIACKEMESTTFVDQKVQQLLQDNFVILQADVTGNDKMDKTLQKQMGVIAPPSILFFDSNGNELSHYRIVGEIGPEKFYQHLKKVLQSKK